jgi:hypothetical protein
VFDRRQQELKHKGRSEMKQLIVGAFLIAMCAGCTAPRVRSTPTGPPTRVAPHATAAHDAGETVSPATPVASNDQMLHKYIWATLGWDGALNATLSAGVDQIRGSPSAWSADAAGYAKRWASDYGESAIGDTAKYAIARIFHQDPSFTRCECTGLPGRARHAVEGPFTARTRDGRRVFSTASLAGFLGGHVVSAATWYPAPLGTRDGLKHAGISLLSKMAVDAFKEFRPRRKP